MTHLQVPHPDVLETVARCLKITQHEGGHQALWEPNDEQRTLWNATWASPLVYALKPRQIGISTSELLADYLFAKLNADEGNPVEVWLVWDTDEKAQSKLEVIEAFDAQLREQDPEWGPAIRRKDNQLLIPTKGAKTNTKIIALTAGGKRVGAGNTCHRLHASELPAWRDASSTWNSLVQSIIIGGRGVIETTMLLGQELPRRLWYGDNDWRNVFFDVESHAEYRMDPAGFNPADPDLPLSKMEELGFTRRDTMAFIQWAFRNKCDGDFAALGREYPQTAEQAFASAQGRWVRVTPPQAPSQGFRVGQHAVRIFHAPPRTSGQVSIWVDTAGGMGRDASAIAVLDKKDQRLVASFVDNEATTDELALVAAAVQRYYTRPEPPTMARYEDAAPRVPPLRIETNGIGRATYQAAVKLGAEVTDISQHGSDGGSSTYRLLLKAKRAIEAGVVYGPPELQDECDSLHTKDGKFYGRKDLLVCIGGALEEIEDNPYRAPIGYRQPAVYDLKKRVRSRSGRRPGKLPL